MRDAHKATEEILKHERVRERERVQGQAQDVPPDAQERAPEQEPRTQDAPQEAKKELTRDDIVALGIVDDPIVRLRPRTDGQNYNGEIVHVDEDRGFVVQKTGQKGLMVHQCEKLESVPSVGEEVRIKYPKDQERKATVEQAQTRKQSRSHSR